MRKLSKCSIAGFIFVSVVGTINHFLYEWSGNSLIVGLFCPVNESVWEHLKLLYFPYLLWSIIEFFILKKGKGILPSKTVGAISGIVFLPLFFYAYTGLVGRSIDALNIISFFIGVLIAFAIDYALIKSGAFDEKSNPTAIIIFIALSLLFMLFTFAPPFLPIFRDPITFTYGI